MDGIFAAIARKMGQDRFLVHAIGFSDKNELTGRYVDTTPDNFRMTMDISVYSFTALAQRAEKLMSDGGSMLTLTYYGAEKVMPHYNVMGVAKAALEASVRYLAVDLGKDEHPRQRDLRRSDQDAGRLRHRRLPLHPEMERVQFAAAPHRRPSRKSATRRSTCCPICRRGVTGEVHHVDSGYHVVGMKAVDAPDISVAQRLGRDLGCGA